jgi:chromatin remodeling complex protein RSC6
MQSRKKTTPVLKVKGGKKNAVPEVEVSAPEVEVSAPEVEVSAPEVEVSAPEEKKRGRRPKSEVSEKPAPVVQEKKRGRRPKSENKEEVPSAEEKEEVPPAGEKEEVPSEVVVKNQKKKKPRATSSLKKVLLESGEPLLESGEPQEKKPRAPRKKVTIESYLERCEVLLALLDNEVERKQKEREKGTRVFRTVRKVVRDLKTDAPKLVNSRRKVYTGEKRVSGLELKCKITNELADFMKIDRGSCPSRNDITNAICAYIHIKKDEHRSQVLAWAHLNPDKKRDLQNPADRMKILPDEKLASLLGYESYKLEVETGKIRETVKNPKTQKREVVVVEDPSLKYYVVQRLIRKQIVSTFKLEKPLEE